MIRIKKSVKANFPAFMSFNLVLYAGLLPWGHALANIQMGLMIISFVFMIIFSRDHIELNRENSIRFLVFSSYFIFCLFSLTYSENLDRGISSLIRKLPLVIFPAYILFAVKINQKHITMAINTFCYSVVIMALLSFSKAFFLQLFSSEYLDWKFVTGENLSESISSVHKLHFSLYALIAIFFFSYSVLVEKCQLKKAVLKYAGIFFLFFFLLMLGTRTTTVTAFIVVVLLSTYSFLKQRQFLRFGLLLTLLISSTFYLIIKNPILQERIKESINYNNEYGINKQWGGTAVRKLIWKYSFNVIQEEPVLGVGIGDAQDELNKSFKSVTESSALKGKNYNTHSEVIQILINTGFLGLVIYFGSQFIIVQFQKRKNVLLILFLVIFFLAGLTEAYLERDMGIRVYAFFVALLYVNKEKYEGTSNT